MGADTNHGGTGNNVGDRHFCMLLFAEGIDKKPTEPSHPTRNVQHKNGTFEIFLFHSVGDSVWALQST